MFHPLCPEVVKILAFVRHAPDTVVLSNNLVGSEYNTLGIVTVLGMVLSLIGRGKIDAGSKVKVEEHNRVCRLVNQDVSWGDVLVRDTIFEVQIVHDLDKLLQLF